MFKNKRRSEITVRIRWLKAEILNVVAFGVEDMAFIPAFPGNRVVANCLRLAENAGRRIGFDSADSPYSDVLPVAKFESACCRIVRIFSFLIGLEFPIRNAVSDNLSKSSIKTG